MSSPTSSRRRLEALRGSSLLGSPAEASFDRLTRLATKLLHAPVALVSLVDEDRQFFKSCVGVSEEIAATRQSSLEESYCRLVVVADEPLVVRDARADPDFADHPGTATFDIGAYLGVPLRFEGEVLGSLCVLDTRPRQWNEEDLALLRDLGDLVETQIMLRTAGAAAEQARQEAEEATARLRFLLQASEALSASLDHRATLDALVGLCVPQLADLCVVDLLDGDGRVERLASSNRNPRTAAVTAELLRYVPEPGARRGVGAVLATGQPLFVPMVTEDEIARVSRTAAHAELLRELTVGSYIVVPLLARGRAIGALSFIRHRVGAYTEADLGVLQEVGRRAGLAVENATVYRERDEIAQTLQRSLLPPSLPEVPGLRLAARYAPQGRGELVGGDFYDVFEAAAGRWVVAVGDVRGKGTAAAAVTGLARHTIRAAAMGHPSPAGILGILNDVLVRDTTDPERFCTVACTVVRPMEGGARVVVASGGHPPPLVRRAGGAVEAVETEGMVVGLFEAPGLDDVTVDLRPGDALVLYTDGVTEARAADGRLLGIEGLTAVLEQAPDTGPDGLADATTRAVADWQSGRPDDDLAVLVVGVPHGS